MARMWVWLESICSWRYEPHLKCIDLFRDSQWKCKYNLITFDREPCRFVLMWLMTLQSEPCHSGGVFTKKMDRNLNLMTFDREPCHLVIVCLMILPSESCHSSSVSNKKDGQKPKPNDFWSRALSFGLNVVNDSPIIALSQWWCV